MISPDLLRRLRNDLLMPVTIAVLRPRGTRSKMSEGYFRFLCPNCRGMLATVNPGNNFTHWFYLGQKFNNIDLLIAEGYR